MSVSEDPAVVISDDPEPAESGSDLGATADGPVGVVLDEDDVPRARPADGSFAGHVVAIGASAGGLDALERFFEACPSDSGAAFVVIQHLSPDHKSMMNNLLSRHTDMPVIMVQDDMAIKGDCVYLIPPGAIMHATAGHLHLTPKNPRGLTLPIDIFFTSLADTYGDQAIGVVLSGTGTDGTRGAVAINASGGFLLAQDPDSAKFDGMPRSVISTGVVDAILAADEIPGRIMAHIRNEPYAEEPQLPPRANRAPLTQDEALDEILRLLLQVGGIDFKDYKPGTIMRRIERRMQVRHIRSLQDYLSLLEDDRAEAVSLRREMLISVTSFFRDEGAFDALASVVIPEILASKQAGDTIRVWNAGVSTGEEAYSIGMLFLEAFERERRWPSLKIFGTDVDPQCVEAAGAGAYPESAAVELTPERLERFFIRKGSSFVVKNELRQCVVLARHNLLADPPFTKMDLVICRNTLIYFKPVAQEHALRSLQYALRPGGYLFLGSSESLSAFSEGLRPVDAKHKIFQRTAAASPLLFDRRLQPPSARTVGVRGPASRRSTALVDADALEAGTSALLGAYIPPSILVNANHEAVHMFGDVKDYVRVREGVASLELNRLLPDPLVPIASALLFKAARDGNTIVSDGIHFTTGDDEVKFLRLSARPIQLKSDERFTLLSFEEQLSPVIGTSVAVNVGAETMERITILEHELIATRENLQATIEELETANEELQATNEELMASNEELQSSNEELQSVNEELNTVNVEYQEKMLILNRINADLDSMAKAAGVATVFVDQDLVLTRFSPDAADIFRLRDSDVGRRLDDFAHSLRYPDLISDIESTLRTERMSEREIQTIDGRRTYLVRILPYSVPSTPVRGAVATFVDLTAFHDLQRLQAIIDAL
ncbi:MAG: two-component system, chemotaxis family, CheB/CheR fusion protein, partial [Actinomycetota bacterium]|nr:two-component system, chemotaxis family, CheB/CheR fusion protein [Actinomycetota bacterium]